MIKRLLKLSGIALNSIWSIIYFVFAVVVILVLSFLFGHSILDGVVNGVSRGVLIGNDSAFALSLVSWFDRFFPNIPYWYPIQGMGVSLFHSYPMSTTFLVIALKDLTGRSAIEVFRVLSFSAFPLTAIGIYFLAWTRLRSQTVALLAGVFFLLSQASWLFQALHGIFAQSFSLIFVAPTFMFFDLFLERILKDEAGNRFLTRLYFVLTVFLLGLTSLTHVVTGTMVITALAIWGILRFVLAVKISFSPKILGGRVFKGLVASLAVVILGQVLIAFWLFPFSSYTSLANKEGLNTFGLSQLQEVSLHLSSILGVGILGQGIYRYDFFFFAFPVLIFFAIGALASIVMKNKFIQVLSAVTLIFLFLTTVPIYLPFLADTLRFFFTAVYFRGLIPALILLPVVAAWGVWAIPSALILGPFRRLTEKIGDKGKQGFAAFFIALARQNLVALVAILSLGLALWSVLNLAHQPPPNPEFKGGYKYQFKPFGPSISNDFENFLQNPLNLLSHQPQVSVSKEGLGGTALLLDYLNRYLKPGPNDILDVSPYAAGGAIMQGAGLVNDIKFINLYHFFASLIHGMWGYQAGVFYGKEPLYKSSKLLVDLTDWFGVKYAILTPGFDPFDKYKDAGWKPVEEFNKIAKGNDASINKGDWGIEAWESPKSAGLVSVTTRPVVLAVTNFEKGGYDHVFRSANLGALMYKDAWIVQGSGSLDDYSQDELNQFDGVILHGYSYGRFGNAWGKLKTYLENGGKVFVDTGWQYVAQDWGDNGNPKSDFSLPEVLPVSKTHWDNIGTVWDGVEVDQALVGNVDFSKFDPPVWDGNPWGMAVAKKGDLRENAKPVMWKGDKILIASKDVGRGRIVWSGINVLSHITRKMNEEEAIVLNKALKPLFFKADTKDFQAEILERKNPDDVTFKVDQSINGPFWLLFRESFSPNWQAFSSSGGKNTSLHVVAGGPGFVLFKVPQAGPQDKIELQYRLGFKDGIFARVLSVLTFTGLLVYLLVGKRLVAIGRLTLFKRLKDVLKRRVNRVTKSISEEEEDY